MDHAPPAFLTDLPKGVLAPDPSLVQRLTNALTPLVDAMVQAHDHGNVSLEFGKHLTSWKPQGKVSTLAHTLDTSSRHGVLAMEAARAGIRAHTPAIEYASQRFVDTINTLFFPLLIGAHRLRTKGKRGKPALVLGLHRVSYTCHDFVAAPGLFAALLAIHHATFLHGRNLTDMRDAPATAGYITVPDTLLGTTVFETFGTDTADRYRNHDAAQALAAHVDRTTLALVVDR